MKVKLAKRLAKMDSLESTYNKIERQNSEITHSIVPSILARIKSSLFPGRVFSSDENLLAALDTLDLKSCDLDSFAGKLFNDLSGPNLLN